MTQQHPHRCKPPALDAPNSSTVASAAMKTLARRIAAARNRIEQAAQYLNIDELETRRNQLETETGRSDLWNNHETARKTTTELASVNETLTTLRRLRETLDDTETLYQLASEENDQQLAEDAAQNTATLETELDQLETRALFTGEHDHSDAVCQITSGEGGTEAQDWAEMLLRMYSRWAGRNHYEIEITAVTEGTEAGLSNVEFILKGSCAYGLMRSEHGVHRLVRNSPFNNDGKRQTSFAAVQAVPFLEETANKTVIDENDLRIDTYRSSGNGGQHANVTDSAVRITHLPTGLVTNCQHDRSQHHNKTRAMQTLAAKLLDHERRQRQAELAGIAGQLDNVGFGSQIRSYVLQPYQMVKDLRSGHETAQTGTVLDGEIGPFMDAWLRWARSQNPAGQAK